MTLLLILLGVLLVICGFFAGAVTLAVVIVNRLDTEGRFHAGPATIIGFVERNHDR